MSAVAEKMEASTENREAFMAFVTDDVTQATMTAAAEKAGFPDNRVFKEGVDKAVNMLSNMDTPSLIVVELGENSNPDSVMDRLAEVCDPGTEVIVLGTDNDVNLYRHLMRMGVRDYLVKPVSEEDLLSAFQDREDAETAAEPKTKTAEIDVVLAAKGGAGASTLAVNAAWQYAKKYNWKTIVLDLDPYFGTTALQLDLEPGRGFRKALENPDRVDDLFLERAMTRVSDKLFLLGSEENLNNPIAASEDSILKIIELTKAGFDRIVVDLPQAQLPYALPLLKSAGSLTIVTDMTLGGLRDAIRICTAVTEMSAKCRQLVVANHLGLSKSGELPQATYEKNLGKQLSAMVPHNSDLFFKSLEDGKAVLEMQKGGKVAVELDKAVTAMSGVKPKQQTGVFAKLFKKQGGK